MTRSRNDLKNIIDSFKEGMEFWLQSFNHGPEDAPKITAASVEDPIQELFKLLSLIRAHTTKVGIAFKPENLEKLTDAAYTLLEALAKSETLLVSVIAQLNPVTLSRLFYDEIVDNFKNLLIASKSFVEDLLSLFDNSSTNNLSSKNVKKDDSINKRLVSVGQLWASCDTLLKLINGGRLSLLESKVKQSIILIEDGLEEFAEWADNPDEYDDEDPFGISDEDSEEEFHDKSPSSRNDEKSEKDKQELSDFAIKWLNKIKLIKLLLSSIVKSLPLVPNGMVVDKIFGEQRKLVGYVDKLVVDLMLSKTLDSEVETITKSIKKSCTALVQNVKSVNKSNETKIRWCTAWESKFEED